MPRQGCDSKDPHLIFDEEPNGVCPVVAAGSFRGYPWEFYARWDHWDFTLSIDPAVDPGNYDLRGSEPADAPRGLFYHEEPYGRMDSWQAGYMATEDAADAIRRACRLAEQWLAAQGLVKDT